jgi:hypothetical protein
MEGAELTMDEDTLFELLEVMFADGTSVKGCS